MEPLPRYWAHRDWDFDESHLPDRSGETRHRHFGRVPGDTMRIWGGSASSEVDADRVAGERLARLEANGIPREANESWYYPARQVREEILEEITADGTVPGPQADVAPEDLLAVITRNRYGAVVLNTDAVFIADIDLEEPEPRGRDERAEARAARADSRASRSSRRPGLLQRLFGPEREETAEPGAQPASDPAPTSPAEHRALARITAVGEQNPELGMHVHRTCAGLRVLVTGADAPPGSERSLQLLEALGSDPLYVRLCRIQGTYRARLSPKPWRLPSGKGRSVYWPMNVYWPHESDQARTAHQHWLTRYEELSEPVAVCRRLSWNGVDPSPAEQQILELHDRLSQADSGRELV
jgi:hypothetical protein